MVRPDTTRAPAEGGILFWRPSPAGKRGYAERLVPGRRGHTPKL